MKVLVACEVSGRVRDAFRRLGHDAWSCDLMASHDDNPYHIVGDCLGLLGAGWDCMVAHPPCTFLTNAGVRWLEDNPERWKQMEHGREFFLSLLNAPIPKIVIENPIPHKHANLPRYQQTIQPYMFGDPISKRTCLWLKGLDPLVIPPKDEWAQPHFVTKSDGTLKALYDNQVWSNKNQKAYPKESPSEDRGAKRSVTYQGIANAIAYQYGGMVWDMGDLPS